MPLSIQPLPTTIPKKEVTWIFTMPIENCEPPTDDKSFLAIRKLKNDKTRTARPNPFYYVYVFMKRN